MLRALHDEAMAQYRALRYAAGLHPEPMVRQLWDEAARRALADAIAAARFAEVLSQWEEARAGPGQPRGAFSRSTSCVPLPVAAA